MNSLSVSFVTVFPHSLVFRKVAPTSTFRPTLLALQGKGPSRDPKQSWRREDDLLSRLNAIPEDVTNPADRFRLSDTPAPNLIDTESQLSNILKYFRRDLTPSIDDYLSNPIHLLAAAALALLFGFFSATAAATIIGSVADWDPLAAAVLLIWTESFTKYYYTLDRPSRILQIVNAFKIGLIYGMTVDALKLTN
ncbi:unnamed protein product [Agarophyton chilense]